MWSCLFHQSRDRGSLEARKQLTEQHLPFPEQDVSPQAGSFVHYLYLHGQALDLCLRQRIKKEVFIEYWVSAIFDNGAPLFLLLSGVQVECHTAIDALKVCLPVINGFCCKHTDPKSSCLPVIMSAEPQFATFVEVDSVLALLDI